MHTFDQFSFDKEEAYIDFRDNDITLLAFSRHLSRVTFLHFKKQGIYLCCWIYTEAIWAKYSVQGYKGMTVSYMRIKPATFRLLIRTYDNREHKKWQMLRPLLVVLVTRL